MSLSTAAYREKCQRENGAFETAVAAAHPEHAPPRVFDRVVVTLAVDWPQWGPYRQRPPRPLATPLDKILSKVAKAHGLTVADVRSRQRLRYLVRARHEFYCVAYATKIYSYAELGKFMGAPGRPYDHTTVRHGIESHQRRIEAHQRRMEAGEA